MKINCSLLHFPLFLKICFCYFFIFKLLCFLFVFLNPFCRKFKEKSYVNSPWGDGSTFTRLKELNFVKKSWNRTKHHQPALPLTSQFLVVISMVKKLCCGRYVRGKPNQPPLCANNRRSFGLIKLNEHQICCEYIHWIVYYTNWVQFRHLIQYQMF